MHIKSSYRSSVLTELVVVDALVLGDVLTLEPCKCVEECHDDERSKHQQPCQ